MKKKKQKKKYKQIRKMKEEREELDAQRQYMVIGTLALLLKSVCVIFYVSRAAAPEGTGGDCVLYGEGGRRRGRETDRAREGGQEREGEGGEEKEGKRRREREGGRGGYRGG